MTTTFNVGDRVKVSDNPTTENGGYVSKTVAGHVGVVRGRHSDGDYEVDVERDSDGGDLTQYIAPRHLTLATFREGDKVRIGDEPKTAGGGFVAPGVGGTEGTVRRVMGRDFLVEGVRAGGRSYSQYIGPDHLTLIEDEPMADWERELLAETPADPARKRSACGEFDCRFCEAVDQEEPETVEAEVITTPTVEDYEAAFALNESLSPGSTKPTMAVVEAFAAHRLASR